MIVAYSAFSRFIFFEKFRVKFEDSNHDRIRMDDVGAFICGMGRIFLLQWDSPEVISDTDDYHSKSGACCSDVTVSDDAGTAHAVETSDS